MKKILFVLPVVFSFSLIIFSFAPIFSQYPSAGKYQGGMPMDAKIAGKIIDAGTGLPVEYAVVAIHKAKDSTLVTGATCNETGVFSIEDLPYGKFYVEVTFVGYKKLTIPNILLIPNQKIANIGTIKLDPSVTKINEVVVSGNKSIEYKIDKKVIDVSSNLVAASGTVVDALQNTPSVQTDVEGNVTLRGSSNFTVLIDGKPSPISGSDALQQIPASTVQSVEIITNPSAKYDAEGSAGIINVIMKKQKVIGMNGIFNVTAGTGDKYSANVNVNYKISKFNFTLGGDFSDMKFHNLMHTSNNKTLKKDTLLLDQTINGNGVFGRNGGGAKAGIDYNINENNTLSLTGNYVSRNNKRNFNTTNFDEYLNMLTNTSNDIYYRGTNNSQGQHKYYYNINLDYQLKLDSKGQQLSASTYFSQGPDDDISDLIQDTTNNYWVHDNTKNILKQHTAQNSFESELRTKLDYTLPIGEKGKLDAGYQGRYSNSKADYHFSNIDPQGTAHEVLSQRDSLDFTDNIQAGYASFSNSMSIIDYQLGLRAEYEHRDINQQISKVDNKIDRVDYFPSVYLTRQLPWDLQLQASYTRRINRPRDWSLDPLPRYMSPIAIRVGNPKLFPEFANSFELNLQKKINDASFISIEGFLRQTNNLMQQVNLFDPKTMITTMTTINIDHDQSIGAEFMLNLAPLKWFNLNSSASLYNYQLFGQIDSAGSKNTTTWNVRINPSFRLVWGTSIQLNYTYNAPTITSQGTRSGFYNSSIGIRQDLLKHKGSLTLNIQNPFGITRMSSTTVSDNLYSSGYFQRESKVFMLTFSYRINNYKVQQNKRPQDDSNGGEQDMNGGM